MQYQKILFSSPLSEYRYESFIWGDNEDVILKVFNQHKEGVIGTIFYKNVTKEHALEKVLELSKMREIRFVLI